MSWTLLFALMAGPASAQQFLKVDTDTSWSTADNPSELRELGKWITLEDRRSVYQAKFTDDNANEIQGLWRQFRLLNQHGSLQKTFVGNGAATRTLIAVKSCPPLGQGNEKFGAFTRAWTAQMVVTFGLGLADQDRFKLSLDKAQAEIINKVRTTMRREVMQIDVSWDPKTKLLTIAPLRLVDGQPGVCELESEYFAEATSKTNLSSNQSTIATSFDAKGFFQDANFSFSASSFNEANKARMRFALTAMPCKMSFATVSLIRPSDTGTLRTLRLAIGARWISNVELQVYESLLVDQSGTCSSARSSKVNVGWKNWFKGGSNGDLELAERSRCAATSQVLPLTASWEVTPTKNPKSGMDEGILGNVVFEVQRQTVGTKQTTTGWTQFGSMNGINWQLNATAAGDNGAGISVNNLASGSKVSSKYNRDSL